MSTDSYVLFFPSTGNAMVSDRGFQFAAKNDFFPNTTGITGKCFLKIDGWHFGVDQSLNITGAGSGAGTIDFQPISFKRDVDNVSSAMLVNCAAGTTYRYVDLIVQNSGASPVTFLGYRFGQAAIASVNWASGDGFPGETVTLEYGTLTIGYAVTNTDGTVGTPTFRGWDRIKNVRI